MPLSAVARRLDRVFRPPRLPARSAPVSEAGRQELRALLEGEYFSREPYTPGFLDTAEGRLDLWMHLEGRLDVARAHVVPWLDSVHPVCNARVLEIGSGTGSATVAFAEVGAAVTCVDVQDRHMAIARRRLELHGVQAELLLANAAELAGALRGRAFDLVLFYASLEHMTIDERLQALAAAFELLAPSGVCAIIETPNRLWPFDDHTALEPFFHWLPPELALRAGARSRRALFADWCLAHPDDAAGLARWGRGASHHELDLALGPGRFEVVSTLEGFWGKTPRRRLADLWSRGVRVLERLESPQWRTAPAEGSARIGPAPSALATVARRLLEAIRAARTERACRRVLRAYAGPAIDDAFLGPWLNLALRRSAAAGPRRVPGPSVP